MTVTTYYKVLNDGKACHGGTYSYPLPKGKRKGAWTPNIENIRPCSRGYHVCTAEDLPKWLRDGNEVYEVELRGATIDHGDKVVAESVRLVRRLEHMERVGEVGICDGECELLDSGIWIVTGNSVIKRADGNSVIKRVTGNSVIKWVTGNSVIERADGNSVIERATGNSVIVKNRDRWGYANNAKVEKFGGAAVLIDRSQGGIKVYSAVPVENVVQQ